MSRRATRRPPTQGYTRPTNPGFDPARLGYAACRRLTGASVGSGPDSPRRSRSVQRSSRSCGALAGPDQSSSQAGIAGPAMPAGACWRTGSACRCQAPGRVDGAAPLSVSCRRRCAPSGGRRAGRGPVFSQQAAGRALDRDRARAGFISGHQATPATAHFVGYSVATKHQTPGVGQVSGMPLAVRGEAAGPRAEIPQPALPSAGGGKAEVAACAARRPRRRHRDGSGDPRRGVAAAKADARHPRHAEAGTAEAAGPG